VLTETVPEAGVRAIRTELTANQTTVFPQGAFHAQMNPDCTPALTLAAFSSDDPGAALVVPQVLVGGLSDGFVVELFGGAGASGLGEEELERLRKAVPQGVIFEVAACRERCGL
jgi:hypothetical protein